MIKIVDVHHLTSSLKHQYLVKTRPFSTAKTIDMKNYLKLTQRDFKRDVFVLHVGTNDLLLNKSPKEISEDKTPAEWMKIENNKIIIFSIVLLCGQF